MALLIERPSYVRLELAYRKLCKHFCLSLSLQESLVLTVLYDMQYLKNEYNFLTYFLRFELFNMIIVIVISIFHILSRGISLLLTQVVSQRDNNDKL